MAATLPIQILDTRSGKRQLLAFHTSPIRMGRNPFNDMRLDEPSVSQWHGIIHFDATRVSYVDLGSKNGSSLGGERLNAHHASPLKPHQPLRLGSIEIQWSPGASCAAVDGAGQSSSASAGTFEPPTVVRGAWSSSASDGDPPGLMPAGAEMPHAAMTAASAPENRAGVSPGAPPLEDPGAASAYEPGTMVFARHGDASDAEDLRTMLHRRPVGMPIAAQAMPSQAVPSQAGPAFSDSARLADTSERARMEALLRTFAQGFLELRRGQERFEQDMGIQASEDDAVAQQALQASSAEALLGFLCDPKLPAHHAVYALTRGHANLALHHVGLLSGIMEGVRSVLDILAPDTVRDAARRDAPREGWTAQMWPSRVGRLWKTFAKRHGDLREGDRFSRELFGRRFLRAYHAAVGQGMQGQAMQGQEASSGHPSRVTSSSRG